MTCVPSHFRLFATPWTVALQAPVSMGFSGQEDWSGLPSPPPEALPSPGTEPPSLACPALAGGFLATSTAWEALTDALRGLKLTGTACVQQTSVTNDNNNKKLAHRRGQKVVAVESPTEGSWGVSFLSGPPFLTWGMMTGITRPPRMGHAVTIQ